MKLLSYLFALWCAPIVLMANPGGITGQSANGCGGAACHGGAANGATSASLTGPTVVDAGSTTDFTFIVGHATQAAAGYNLSITRAGGANGTFEGLDGSQVSGGELTHIARKNMAAGSASFPFRWTAPVNHGVYTVRGAGNAVNGNGGRDGDIWNTMTSTLTVRGADITAPAAGQTICVGQSITMTWTQTGMTNFNVEYSADGNAWTNLGSVSATANTYTWNIPANQVAGGAYRLRLVDAGRGVSVAQSNSFAISAGPAITTQPIGQNICVGRGLVLLANATGATAYRWRKNGVDIPGGTNQQFQIAVSKATDAGSYDCVIFGCSLSSTTNPAVIVIDTKPAITAQPLARTICENDTTSFSVTATGTALTYQWFKNDEVMVGKTGSTVKITLASSADEGMYKCEVRGACDPAVISAAVKLTVNIAPKITTQPKTQVLKVGDELLLTVKSDGANLNYVWKKGGVALTNGTTATFRIASAAKADAGPYTCTVTNSCGNALSAVATITVTDASGPGRVAFPLKTLALGTVYTCGDTTVSATVTNSGASPVTLATLATASPELTITGLTLPAVIAPGAALNFSIQFRPTMAGAYSANVIATATSAGSADTMVVTASAAAPFTLSKDTIKFGFDANDKQCVSLTTSAPCAFMINSVQIGGDQGVIEHESPTLPHTVEKAGGVEVCLKTIVAGNSGSGMISIATNAGMISIPWMRVGLVSVNDERGTSLVVAPNPANYVVAISSNDLGPMSVTILDGTGSTVFAMSTEGGTVTWSTSGVASGMYLVRIERMGTLTTRMISVIR
ncbi:hypothetical protein BH10BAC6_BH10BAC6_17330 [soil metagenome]